MPCVSLKYERPSRLAWPESRDFGPALTDFAALAQENYGGRDGIFSLWPDKITRQAKANSKPLHLATLGPKLEKATAFCSEAEAVVPNRVSESNNKVRHLPKPI
jgi:hypothetical protein